MKLTESTLRKIVRKLIREKVWDVDLGYIDDVVSGVRPNDWSGVRPSEQEIQGILSRHKLWRNRRESGQQGQQANLAGADLSGMMLSGYDFLKVNMSNANLSKTNFDGSDLYGVNFTGANLSNANLAGTDLGEANFTNANLKGADLSGANIRDCISIMSLMAAASLQDLMCTEDQAEILNGHPNFSPDLVAPYDS
jgi:uncharacterized protein YjbI with pentapeptide repeats